MKRGIIILTVILLLFSCSAEAVKNDATEVVDTYVLDKLEYTAGLAIGVFDENDSMAKYYGFISREPHVDVTEDTVFEWGSVTKLLVWVSIMQLEEDGKLALTDAVNDYLPEHLQLEEKFGVPITIFHLMNHQAGFSETIMIPETTDQEAIPTLEEALIYHRPQEIYEPGTVVAYSNYGTALAGYVVEQISGQDFSAYVHEHIFAPLQMTDTALYPDWQDVPSVRDRRLANQSYDIMEDRDEELGHTLSYIELYPAGSCTGTLEDLMTFGQGLLPGTEESLLLFEKPETLDKIYTPTTYYVDTDIPRIAHGLWYELYGEGTWGHMGNTEGYTSHLVLDPEKGKGIAIMSNEQGETYFCCGLPEQFFGDYHIDSYHGETTDISGIYTSARARFDKGYGRILQYMGGFLPVKKTGDYGEYEIPITHQKMTTTDKDVYLLDNGNGFKSLHVYHEGKEGPVLEAYSSDVFKDSTWLFGIKVALFILFVLFVLISIVRLVYNLIMMVRKQRNFPFVSLFTVVTGFAVYQLLLSESLTSRLEAQIYTGVVLIGLVGTVLSAIFSYRQEEKYLFNIITAFVVLVNVVYWQWFMIS